MSTNNPGILMLSAFALIFDVPVLALNLLYTAVPVLILHCRNLKTRLLIIVIAN